MLWKDLIYDIIEGYKKLLFFIAVLILGAAILWGVLSIVLIASGKLPFSWWHLPCWILLLTLIAGVIGGD